MFSALLQSIADGTQWSRESKEWGLILSLKLALAFYFK